MCKIPKLKCFIVLFYIFGQAPYFPITNSQRKLVSFLISFMPSLIYIAVLTYCMWIVVTNPNQMLDTVSIQDRIVNCSITFTAFIPSVFVILESFRHSNRTFRIFDSFQFIANYMKDKLNSPFEYDDFWSDYLMKMSVIFSIHFITCVTRFNTHSKSYVPLTEVGIFLIQTYKLWTKLHALFYIDLAKFTLFSINAEVLRIECDSILIIVNRLKHEHIRRKLRHLKYIHLKLWYMVQWINVQFEWSLIGNLLDTFVFGTSSVYYTFVLSESHMQPSYLILRNYHLNYFY